MLRYPQPQNLLETTALLALLHTCCAARSGNFNLLCRRGLPEFAIEDG